MRIDYSFQRGPAIRGPNSLADRDTLPHAVDAAVTTEVESTPLGSRIDAATDVRIRRGASEVWAAFTTSDGTLDAPFATYLLAGRKPGASDR